MNKQLRLQLNTPVAFFVFNRPDTTKVVFEQIRMARVPKLLIIADGPRSASVDDYKRCKAVRNIVAAVDWPCEVLTNFSDANMGCRERVVSGLDWVFSNVSEAIILEDDCLPDRSFFRFCEETLDRYRDDEKIMMISGNNYLNNRVEILESYYFSSFTHIWGWATWARAWRQYDAKMADWPQLRSANWLAEIFPDAGLCRYWERIFEYTFREIIQSWAYRLNYSCLVRNGLAVVPKVNLVTNIGFGQDATITRTPNHLANVLTESMPFPLIHPSSTERNTQADLHVAENIYFKPLLPLPLALIFEKVKRMIIK